MFNKNKQNITSYRIKLKTIDFFSSLIRYLLLGAVGYVIIIQLVYIFSYSFRSTDDIFDPSVVWIPKNFTLSNFKIAIDALDFLPHLFTTLFIQILSGIIEVFTCALPAYGFARFNYKGKNLLFAIVIIMILLPPQVTAVSMSLNYAHFDILGIFGVINKLTGVDLRPNLLNTGFVFWLPSIFGVGLRSGLFIFIYRQFFIGLPKELEEAASIDGANSFATFLRVVVPSSGVAFLTVTIFSVVWHWNEYYNSILYFDSNYPLSVSLKQLHSGLMATLGQGAESSITYTMAAAALCVFPVLLLYVVLQRKFIASIDRVGIVG